MAPSGEWDSGGSDVGDGPTASASVGGDDPEGRSDASPDSGSWTDDGEPDGPDETCDSDGHGDDTCDSGGVIEPYCDPYAQDCPDGEKCNPFGAATGQHDFDGARCVPLDPMPVDFGEECTVQDYRGSGRDNCRSRAVCSFVDEISLTGICVELCSTTAGSSFECENRSEICWASDDGYYEVCLPPCDPLAQDCPPQEHCYQFSPRGFICWEQDRMALDPGVDSGYGAPCFALNYCDPGLQCVGAEFVPNCASSYCCTEWCDTTAPQECPDAAAGQVCIQAGNFDGSPPFPGLENVGVCGVTEFP